MSKNPAEKIEQWAIERLVGNNTRNKQSKKCVNHRPAKNHRTGKVESLKSITESEEAGNMQIGEKLSLKEMAIRVLSVTQRALLAKE